MVPKPRYGHFLYLELEVEYKIKFKPKMCELASREAKNGHGQENKMFLEFIFTTEKMVK